MITTIWLHDADLGDAVAQIPWVADGVRSDELEVVDVLLRIHEVDVKLAKQVAAFSWLTDEVNDAGRQTLYVLLEADPELARRVAAYQWVTDDVELYELEAIILALLGIGRKMPELASHVVASTWFADDVTSSELFILSFVDINIDSEPEISRNLLSLLENQQAVGLISNERALIDLTSILGHGYELALKVVEYVNALPGDLGLYLLDSLANLPVTTGALGRLAAEPWFDDGLSEEEAAFAITLKHIASDSPRLYTELLQARFIQTRTISLPLAGDVNIWIVQNAPFDPAEDLLTIIEDTARITEEFLGVPFPTTDIILLVVVPDAAGYGTGGQHHGTHMMLTRLVGEVLSLPHETGHYYFIHKPHWLQEGGAQFVAAYVNHRNGIQNLDERKIEVERHVQSCVDEGIENIQDVTYRIVQLKILPGGCAYAMGENFLLSMFQLMGEEAMSAALSELYVSSREGRQAGERGRGLTEDEIYSAFVEHAPPESHEEFRDLYRRLHGSTP